MNSLVIILIAMAVLVAGYVFYGRWLAKKWGIDEKAKTPAFTHEDGEDFVPSSKFTVFSHQFSSIAGAGPVTGPILASVFGWVPVLLWLLIGGLFFGAVQDFGALYASVKNEGKSMGMIIEKYIGKTGRKLFMLFCWLFTLLVIAAFTDMVAGTFVGTGLEDAGVAYANGSAASISMLFILVAVIFGLIQKKVGKMNEWVKAVVDNMDLHHHGIPVPGIRNAHVASDAAQRLHDHLYVTGHDHRRCTRCGRSTSRYGAECI